MIFFWIAVALGIGAVVAFIAREKGRSPLLWAFYGTVAPVIALPHVLLVRMPEEENWAPVRFGIPEPEQPCPHCGAVVRGEAIVCRHCHKPLYEARADTALGDEKEAARAKKTKVNERDSRWLDETFSKFAGPAEDVEEEEADAREMRANPYERVTDPAPEEPRLNVPREQAAPRPKNPEREAVMAERMRREEVRSRPVAAAAESTEAEFAAMEANDERRAEETRQAEIARRAEDERRVEEARVLEEARRIDEARRLEEHRRAEEARLADEARLAAEEARRARAAHAAEAAQLAEEAKRAEEARVAAAEAARRAEEARIAEEQRQADEMRKAEAARQAAEAARAEAERLEAERLETERRIAEARAQAERLAAERSVREAKADAAEPRLGMYRPTEELVIDPSERLSPSGTSSTGPSLTAEPGMRLAGDNDQPRRPRHSRPDDGRLRMPLSSDGSVRRPEGPAKKRDMRKIAALAAAAAVVGFAVPWAAQHLPGTKPNDHVTAVPPPGLVPPPSSETAQLPPGTATLAPAPEAKDEAKAEEKPASDGEEIGTAKLATPIPTGPRRAEPKAVPQPFQSPEAQAKGKADASKSDAAKAEPTETAKAEPQAARPEPADPKSAPSRLDPPASQRAAKAPPPAKPAPPPAPKREQRQQTPEDFMAMVGRALGGSPSRASTTTASVAEDDPAVGTAGGPLVQQVQERLRDRGFDPGSIDGRTGPKTVQAIRAYQQSVGMKPDGRIDMALMERLGIVGQQLHVFGR